MTKKILAILLALVYSAVYVILGPMIKAQDLSFNTSQILPFALWFVVCSFINLFVFSVIPKWRFEIKSEEISRWIDKVGERKLFLGVWAFIFMAWIPAFLILYPGVLSYDMISQTNSALGVINNNHHPVLHTWLIRIFMKLGAEVFSSYEHGIGLLSLAQMIILSYALARLVMLLKKKKVPLLFVFLTTLFSAIWFMNACLSVTMIKDTLHAAFLVLFVCHFAEIVTNPLEYVSRKQNLILLPIVSFLMCALRNNGIHIYVFCFAILLILRISKIKKAKLFIPLVIVILLPVFMFKIYTGPVFKALDIAPGQVREALCIPIQQLQRVAVSKEEELTPQQTEKMGYYIDNLKWMGENAVCSYNAFFADYAKSCFYSDHYNEDPIAFWKFYLEIGKQFPVEYIEAFLCNTLGYWYPGEYTFSYVVYENYSPEVFPVPLERKSVVDIGFLKTFYKSLCESEFWRNTPGLRLFFVPGFAPWILCYALILAWKKRGFITKVFPLFLPLIAQYGIMILSPMSSFRYSWPFFLMLPLCFIGIYGDKETEKESIKYT